MTVGSAAYPGGPSHNAGALVFTETSGKDAKGRFVGFTTPSAIALALDLALKAVDRARELQNQLDSSEVVTPFGPGTSVTYASTSTLYDYVQQCMTVLAFSFQALEAFCNETISAKVSGTYPLERRRTISHVTADELEVGMVGEHVNVALADAAGEADEGDAHGINLFLRQGDGGGKLGETGHGMLNKTWTV